MKRPGLTPAQRRFVERMTRARLDSSCSAYETALVWLQRYPAAEVERRLVEIIEAKRALLRQGLRDSGQDPRLQFRKS